MATLQSVGRKILTYVSPKLKEQSTYFEAAREIAAAQFYLGNKFQETFLWQEVADHNMNVARLENLLYGCFFQEDDNAMIEADHEFMERSVHHLL